VSEDNEDRTEVRLRIDHDTVVIVSIVAYVVIALIMYGWDSAYYVHLCEAKPNEAICHDPGVFFGPLFLGVLWPLYWVLHLATLLFM